MPNRFLELLETKPYLLVDGATGTNLFAMGLQTGDAPELWNTAYPERLARLHQAFLAAGSDIILTNSFGGTRYRLKLHQAQDRVGELNRAAARIARQQADATGRLVAVAGSMGPTGELLAPLGTLSFADVKAAFAEQAQALAEGGVDVVWIETMSSREELTAAVAGAATCGLPIVCTLSFDTNGRTMMGLTPADLVALCRELVPSPVACGANCGVGAAELVVTILNLSAAAGPDGILVAKANCGIPEYVDGALRYNGTPALMADYARLVRDAGARIIGGCCGTTPAHIQAMKTALEQHRPGVRPDLDSVIAHLGEISTGARAQLRGEMNPLQGAASGEGTAQRGMRGRRRQR